MIDGGILLALSTTIFGGIGGYCMRVWKAVAVGGDLKRYYDADARRDLSALRVSVSAIERRLADSQPMSRRTAEALASDSAAGPVPGPGHLTEAAR